MKVDMVITGSGVAAAALAWKILRADPGASILILEAGTTKKMRDFATFQKLLVEEVDPYIAFRDKKYPENQEEGENTHEGNAGTELHGSRLTIYGGSTVHWGGWAFRMKEEDFRPMSLSKKSIDWPFGYDELKRYYDEAEHYIGVSGDSRDATTPRNEEYPFRPFPFTFEDGLAIEGLKKLHIGYGHLPIARQGVSHSISSHAPCQTTGKCKYCPFGARYVAANALDDLRNLEAHPNFSIRTRTVVQEIVMGSRTRAAGVRCLDLATGREETIEAETVIVASGAIESPKLLQCSGGIGNQYGLVGRHLITHPYFFFEAMLPDNSMQYQPEMGFPTLVSRHFDSLAEQKDGKFILVYPPDYPRYGTQKSELHRLMQAGRSRQEIEDIIKSNVTLQWQGMIEVFSERENYVRGLKTTNKFGLPQTSVRYYKPRDFDSRMKVVLSHVEKIFTAMGARDTLMLKTSFRADHAACTTRMSDDPREGVVDRNLKVHGTENIYVCSNSSFASLGAVNPTLTLTALSLRLADHLLAERQIKSGYMEACPGDLALTPVGA